MLIRFVIPWKTFDSLYFFRVSRQFPPKENWTQLKLGLGSRLELVLELGGNQTIDLEKDYPSPPVRVMVWLELVLGLGAIAPGMILKLSFNEIKAASCKLPNANWLTVLTK